MINNLPALRSHVRSFTTDDVSKTFRFYLTATNQVGSVQSETVSFILAAVPDKPSTKPTLNLELTTASSIQVDYAPMTESENGGSPIISYELQIYSREQSYWLSIAGGEGFFNLLNTLVYSEGIEKGETY